MNHRKTKLRIFQGFIVLGLFICSLGCSPSNLMWILNRDSKAPAAHPLPVKDGKKEITVAILCSASATILNSPEFAGIDRELASQIGRNFMTETVGEKKPVIVVEQSKINQLKKSNPQSWDLASRTAIAKKLGADYIIEVDLTHFSLYSRDTGREVCQGQANATVTVYDSAGDGTHMFQYESSPKPPLRPTGDSSPNSYRIFFIDYLAKDIVRKHVAHTPERDRPTSFR
jgi:hypothetical protein